MFHMTQAPWRLFDVSSTGSSASVQLFACPETSFCAASDCVSIHESNPRRVRNPSSLHGSLKRSHASFSEARSPLVSSAKRDGLETRIGNRDVDYTLSSISWKVSSLDIWFLVEVSNKFCLAIYINYFTRYLNVAEYNHHIYIYYIWIFENYIWNCIHGLC